MRSIRGGKGLGDALYVQAVARHIVMKGERLTVATSWPDVFRPLGAAVEFTEFRRDRIDILAHYSMRKFHATRQWQDVCLQSGVGIGVPLRLDWAPTGPRGSWLRDQAAGRRIVAVQLPRVPMDRRDGFGKELLPDCRVLEEAARLARDHGAFLVQIGSGKPLYDLGAVVHEDLANKTTVCELLDVASACDAFLGYVSFIVPLAESLDKPALLVWSRRGTIAGQAFVRQITPGKVLEKLSSHFVWDDCAHPQLVEAVDHIL